MRPIECFLDPVCPWCWITSGWLRRVRDATVLDVRWRFLSLALLDAATARPRPDHIAVIHARGHQHLTLLAAVRRLDGEDAVDRALLAIGEALWDASPSGRGWQHQDDARTARTWVARPLAMPAILSSVGVDPTIVDAVGAVDTATVADETALAVQRVGRGLGTPVITLDPPDGPTFFGPVLAQAPTDPTDAVRLWEALATLAVQPGFAELRTNRRAPLDVPLMRALQRTDVGRAADIDGTDDIDRIDGTRRRRQEA